MSVKKKEGVNGATSREGELSESEEREQRGRGFESYRGGQRSSTLKTTKTKTSVVNESGSVQPEDFISRQRKEQ